jgi:hypothetical protein
MSFDAGPSWPAMLFQSVEQSFGRGGVMAKRAAKVVPVTKVRILIPKGVALSEVISKLEISFVEAKPGEVEAQFASGHCCVDAAVVSPVSTVSDR